MRSSIVHGTFLGIILFICLLGLHASGLAADAEKVRTLQTIDSLLSYVCLVIALFLCLRKVQAAERGTPIGYGRALGAGALMALTGGVVFGVGHWVYGTLVNPHYQEALRSALLANVQLSAEQLAEIEPRIHFITSPLGVAISQGVPLVVFGVLMSLVLALFFRRTELNGRVTQGG